MTLPPSRSMTSAAGQGRRRDLGRVTLTLVWLLLVNLLPAGLGCILLLNGWTPKSIGERTLLADIVVTAYVRKAYKDMRTQDNTYTAEVAVVRVLRGQRLLEDIPAISDDEYGERRVYNVSNFGDKIMCYADVDEGATYVLFVTTYDGRLSAKYDDIFGAATRYNDDAENEALEAQGWKPWTIWSHCTVSCGKGQGHQTRKRKCIRKEPETCDGLAGEQRGCNSFNCKEAHDILALLDLSSLPLGVSTTPNRKSAFHLGPASDLTLPATSVFRWAWPADFSVLVTARSKVNGRGFILTLSDSRGVVRMGVQVGLEPRFEYTDNTGQPGRHLSPSFDVDLADGAWHQFSFRVRAQAVTLFVDCRPELTQPLARDSRSALPVGRSVLSLGKPYISHRYYPAFEGDIEQMVISSDPDAAEQQCSPDVGPITGGPEYLTTSTPWATAAPPSSTTTHRIHTTTTPVPTTASVDTVSWSAWSPCSATCGRGTQARTAYCRNNRHACAGQNEASVESRVCYIGKCRARCRPRCRRRGGICIPPGRCACRSGYFGTSCQHVSCRPGCYNGGVCRKPDVCTCTSGYEGSQCQNAICDPPCGNGGRCIRPSVCACPYGYLQPSCEPVCRGGCYNGGTCIAPGLCRCPDGYTGSTCQIATCRTGCHHGGHCVAPDVCSCPAGYGGVDCSIILCNPPCSNGGVCTSGRYCSCLPGFYGYRCERALCSGSCMNGGQCTGYNTCACARGFKGNSCQKSYCPHGCGNGHCAYSGRCRCHRGYHGRQCQFRKCRYVPVQEPYVIASRHLQRAGLPYSCGPWGYSTCTKIRYIYRLVYKTNFKTTYRCKVS